MLLDRVLVVLFAASASFVTALPVKRGLRELLQVIELGQAQNNNFVNSNNNLINSNNNNAAAAELAALEALLASAQNANNELATATEDTALLTETATALLETATDNLLNGNNNAETVTVTVTVTDTGLNATDATAALNATDATATETLAATDSVSLEIATDTALNAEASLTAAVEQNKNILGEGNGNKLHGNFAATQSAENVLATGKAELDANEGAEDQNAEQQELGNESSD